MRLPGEGLRPSRSSSLCEIIPAEPVSRDFMKRYLLCAVSVTLLAGASSLAPGMQAAALTVNNTNESGPGSLRDAIAVASRGDGIVFDPFLTCRPIIITPGELLLDAEQT